MKVLIVDDSKTMRMIVKRTLRQAGFGQHEVVEASNGAEALQSIEASKPDLVLSDWNMPEKNGLELLQALNEQNIDVPFGFVTSEGTPEMYRTATLNGARFLIAKPFTPDMFREHLSEVLQ
jgi:two-component system chemotaxis response regulator CheY